MIYLYQDPSGEKIFSPSHGSLPGRVNRGSDGDSKTKEKVTFLEKRVQELELELKDYQVYSYGTILCDKPPGVIDGNS